MLRETSWSAPPSRGFGKETIRLQLADRELERHAQSESWELGGGDVLSLCARKKDFVCFDPAGNKRWESNVYAGDDVRHPVVSKDTLYYFSYSSCHAVDLETGEESSSSAPSTWRDVWPSRDGPLVSVEEGHLLVRDQQLRPVVKKKVPFTINRAVHHQNARMVTLSFDDKRVDHAVMSEDGRVLFRSNKHVLFRGSELGEDLWQVLADERGCEVLHVPARGKASTHPLPEPALAVFGQPDGFVALLVPELENAPLRLQNQAGECWPLGSGKLAGLMACPDGGVLVPQEDGVRFFQNGELKVLHQGTEPMLPARLSDGSFLLVGREGTTHLSADGTRTQYPDAWAARESLGGEVVSRRLHLQGMGLDEGTAPGWHNFLTDAERFAGPPVSIPGPGLRATSTRLDFVRSKRANSLARAGLKAATRTDGSGLISAATLAIRNKDLDIITACATPAGAVQAGNSWSPMVADQTPGPVSRLELGPLGLVAVDTGGNTLSIEFGESYAPVTERPEARDVATLAGRMLKFDHVPEPAVPAFCDLLAQWAELAPASNFIERIALSFPDLTKDAAEEVLGNPSGPESDWLKKLYDKSHRAAFGYRYLQAVRGSDELAEITVQLVERVPDLQRVDDLVRQSLVDSRPEMKGSDLDRRVQGLEWLTRHWEASQLEKSGPVLLELLVEKADYPGDHKVLSEAARRLDQKDLDVTRWWRQTLQDLTIWGVHRRELMPLVEGGPKHTGIVEQGSRVLVGGAVVRTRQGSTDPSSST